MIFTAVCPTRGPADICVLIIRCFMRFVRFMRLLQHTSHTPRIIYLPHPIAGRYFKHCHGSAPFPPFFLTMKLGFLRLQLCMCELLAQSVTPQLFNGLTASACANCSIKIERSTAQLCNSACAGINMRDRRINSITAFWSAVSAPRFNKRVCFKTLPASRNAFNATSKRLLP